MKLRIGMSLFVLFTALAVWIYADEPAEKNNPADADASRTQWLCKSCSHAFRLTAHEVESAAPSRESWPPLACPKCRANEAYLALCCSKCSMVYFGLDMPGGAGECPRCAVAQTEADEKQPAEILFNAEPASEEQLTSSKAY